MKRKSNILCLSPHTDDVELGVGGTINRLVKEGHKVFYVAFSSAVKSIPKGFSKDSTIRECKKAVKILGVYDLDILDYPTREFQLHRQRILDDLLGYKKKINPGIVFLPSSYDLHQDHRVIYNEGIRAFRDRTMYGYELPWNNLDFGGRVFFVLREIDVKKKDKAFKCYKTQRHRHYCKRNFIQDWCKLRGTQVGKDFAECFEVIREVL